MLKESSHIDDIFNRSLSDYGEDMPDYSWKIIEDQLKKDKKKKIIVFYWIAAASVSIFLSFILGYYSGFSTKEKKSNLISVYDKKTIGQRNIAETDDGDEVKTEIYKSEKTFYTKSTEKKSTFYSDKETEEKDDGIYLSDLSLDIDDFSVSIDSVIIEHDDNIGIDKKILLKNDLTDIKESDILNIDNSHEEINPLIASNDYSRWSLGGQFSSGFSATNSGIENVGTNQFSALAPLGDNWKEEDNLSNRILSYSAGIKTSYSIKKRLDFQSGILITKYEKSFSNTELPLLLNYKLINKKYHLNTIGGTSLGMISSKAQSAMNLQAVIGFEGAYDITKRISINLTPMIKYPLPVNKSIITDYNFRYFGVNTGLNYKL